MDMTEDSRPHSPTAAWSRQLPRDFFQMEYGAYDPDTKMSSDAYGRREYEVSGK
jgi:hypothetical protein